VVDVLGVDGRHRGQAGPLRGDLPGRGVRRHLDGDRAAVGQGIHRFRDPELVEEFSAELMTLDVTRPRRYAIDWRPGRVEFFVDGERTRSARRRPAIRCSSSWACSTSRTGDRPGT
jgi:hypothetical protein